MKYLVITFLLFAQSLAGQNINLDIHTNTLEAYIELENNLASELLPNESQYMLSDGIAQPLRFLRKGSEVPALVVEYFFKEQDSMISYVTYEWDVSHFEKKDDNKQTKEFQDGFIEKYKKLKSDFSLEYGKPDVKENYSNLSVLDPENTFVESSKWQSSENTELELNATVSNYYEKRGMMTINPVHRIRLYIRNKTHSDAKLQPELTDERIALLDQITKDFISALSAGDFTKSREYISESTLSKINDGLLFQLKSSIEDTRKLELSFSNIEEDLLKDEYAALLYKYIDTEDLYEDQYVTVKFDTKDKITSFKIK